MDNDKQKIPATDSVISPLETKSETMKSSSKELVTLVDQVADTNNVSSVTKVELDSLNTDVKIEKEQGVMDIIIEILKDPQKFLAMLFGGETGNEKSENINKWEKFQDSEIITFFEGIKDTFSLLKENTNPEQFKEKYNYENKKGTKFRDIMEFQKKTGKTYSLETLMILWSNRDNLLIKEKKLNIKKKSGIIQEIDTKDDKAVAESIVPKESVIDKIPLFTQNLEASLTKYFSNIPEKYKNLIPGAIDKFELELINSVEDRKVPKLSKERIYASIESTYPIPFFAKSIVKNNINSFLTSDEGLILRNQYANLWEA